MIRLQAFGQAEFQKAFASRKDPMKKYTLFIMRCWRESFKGMAAWSSSITALALSSVAVLVVCPNSNALASAGEPSWCAHRVVHDYLAPVRQMKPIRRVPRSGRLPFGPSSLRLVNRTGPLMVGSGTFGYELSTEAAQPLHVDWAILTRISSISHSGHIKRTLITKKSYVRAVRNDSNLRFMFHLPNKPALYRYDIEFQGRSGKLGSYSEYLRVVPRRAAARIRLSSPTYRAGSEVWFRLENVGTAAISFGELFSIERYNGSAWEKDAATPVGAPAVAIELAGGVAYRCKRVTLPQDGSPGLYRLSQKVKVLRQGTMLVPAAQFEVVG